MNTTNTMQLIGPRTLAIEARSVADELNYMRDLVRADGHEHIYGLLAALTRAIDFTQTIERAAQDATARRVDDIRARLGEVGR